MNPYKRKSEEVRVGSGKIRVQRKPARALTIPLRSSGANTAHKHGLLWAEMSCSVQARHAGYSGKDMTLEELWGVSADNSLPSAGFCNSFPSLPLGHLLPTWIQSFLCVFPVLDGMKTVSS